MKLTSKDHALTKALLKTTILAPVSLSLRYLAVPVSYARVNAFVLYCPLEEPFTSVKVKDK